MLNLPIFVALRAEGTGGSPGRGSIEGLVGYKGLCSPLLFFKNTPIPSPLFLTVTHTIHFALSCCFPDMTDNKTCVWCAAPTENKRNIMEGPRQVGRHGDADTFPRYSFLLFSCLSYPM